MILEELEKLIICHKSEGHLPFFVNCTTGTTVYGAYDPIEPIADICEKYGIWLHIDVSKSHKSVLFFLKSHSNQHNIFKYNIWAASMSQAANRFVGSWSFSVSHHMANEINQGPCYVKVF